MRTVSYDPLWKTLIDHHINRTELKEKAGLSKGTITRMGKNESVTKDVLMKICNCQFFTFFTLTPVNRDNIPLSDAEKRHQFIKRFPAILVGVHDLSGFICVCLGASE